MMNTDENMPIRGTGQNGKTKPTKKSGKRSRKPAQQETAEQQTIQPEAVQQEAVQQEAVEQAAPEPDQIEQPQEPVTVAMENPFTDTAPDAPAAASPDERAETAPAPISLQTITNAYSDFTRKSIEQTSSFFEQLAGVRSLNKALELQGEFAQQTYETFVAESRKIRELHSELTMQRLRHLEGFVAKMKSTRLG